MSQSPSTVSMVISCSSLNFILMIIAKGTGISVYNVIREQLNLSFTLDGGPSTAYVYSWDTRCYSASPGSPSGCYNTSVYNAQSLSYGPHTLNITMFTYLPTQSYSDFFLDYAAISSSTGSFGPSNQQPQSVSPPHSKQLAAPIGGAVGGGIVVMVLAVLYYRYRSRGKPEHIDSAFLPTTFVTNPPHQVDTLHDWSPSSLLPDPGVNGISPFPMPPKAILPSVAAHVPTSSTATEPTSGLPTSRLPRDVILAPPLVPSKPGISSATGEVPTSSVAAADHSSSSPPHPDAVALAHTPPSTVTSTATGSPGSPHLVGEQYEIVQSLIRHNIPLPAVVGVMQGFLGREEPVGGGDGSGIGVTQSEELENPPDYDFI